MFCRVNSFFPVGINGPGKTLSGLIGRIDSGVRTFPVETAEELAQAAKEVRAC